VRLSPHYTTADIHYRYRRHEWDGGIIFDIDEFTELLEAGQSEISIFRVFCIIAGDINIGLYNVRNHTREYHHHHHHHTTLCRKKAAPLRQVGINSSKLVRP